MYAERYLCSISGSDDALLPLGSRQSPSASSRGALVGLARVYLPTLLGTAQLELTCQYQTGLLYCITYAIVMELLPPQGGPGLPPLA